MTSSLSTSGCLHPGLSWLPLMGFDFAGLVASGSSELEAAQLFHPTLSLRHILVFCVNRVGVPPCFLSLLRRFLASCLAALPFASLPLVSRPWAVLSWPHLLSLSSVGLTGAPHEPLRTCDERFLAQKTLFLLALASAKHIGELHALSYRVSHSRNWGEVSFSFVPGFMAKAQDPSSLAPRFEGFTVPALPNARYNRNGRLLCPVRKVSRYLDCNAAHRPRCERLFVTAGRSKEQGVARRYRRPLSPSGSGRQYHVPTSSPVRISLFLPLKLRRLVVLLRLFFSRRTSPSTKC